VNLSESVSLTDSISKAAAVNLSESVSMTDSISKTTGVNLTESVSLTDSIAKSAGVNLTESVSLTDSIANSAGVNLTESVSFTDAISKTAPVNLSETIGFTDDVSTLSISFPDDWNKKVISTNSAMVNGTSNLTNFPVLITLTSDSDLSTSKVGSSGQGIRFTSDGTTLLDYEIEEYTGDTNSGTLVAWVKVPTLDDDDTTYIYIHYGRTIAQSDADATTNNVWAESGESQNYVVVNHFMSALDTDDYTEEQIGSVAGEGDDFNTNNMDTATNQVTGKIGKALDMNEGIDNERVCLEDTFTDAAQKTNCNGSGTIFDDPVSVRTVSLWYKADEVDTRQVLFEEGGESKGQVIYLFDDKIFACTWKSNVEECVSYTTTANEWHHVALVWVSGTTSYLYHDGEEVATFEGKTDRSTTNASALGNIAGDTRMDNGDVNYSNGESSFDGIIDEFRVIDTEHDVDYIATDYNNQNTGTWQPSLDVEPNHFTYEGVLLSESISFTDSISKAADVNLSETVLLTDSISKTAGVNLTESVSLTDSISKVAGVNLSDTVLLTDSIAKSAGVNLSDTVLLVDSISKTAPVNLSESVSLTDETSRAAGVNLSESISLTDETSRAAGVNLTESVS